MIDMPELDARQMGRFLQMGTRGSDSGWIKPVGRILRCDGNGMNTGVLRNLRTILVGFEEAFPAGEGNRSPGFRGKPIRLLFSSRKSKTKIIANDHCKFYSSRVAVTAIVLSTIGF
jgi:hypothetical protein